MGKVNFTADRVASFKCELGKQQSIYWDAKTPGLGLRVTGSGAKSYVFESRLHGKTLRVTIGNARAWSLGKAQTEAARLKILVDQGMDPREEKAAKQVAAEFARIEAKRQDVTLEDAWEVYLEERRAKWSELSYRDHLDLSSRGGERKKRGKGITAPGPLAPLMPRKLCALTASVIKDWMIAEAARRPTRTRLAFNLLRTFHAWCETKDEYRGLMSAGALDARMMREALPKRHPKTDVIQREQLPSWFKALFAMGNPVMSAYLVGLLMTGARREELAGLRWVDVDFQWRSLTIRDKVEGQRIVPLPPYLASLLLGLKRLNETPPNVRQIRRLRGRDQEWKPSAWVFFSKTSADGKLASPNAALHRVCQTAGIPPVTLHGLRRSFSSLAEWTETPTGVVAQIMGHKPSATAERHYKVRPLDLLRVWHDKLEAWVLKQAGVEFVAHGSGLQLAAS